MTDRSAQHHVRASTKPGELLMRAGSRADRSGASPATNKQSKSLVDDVLRQLCRALDDLGLKQ